MRRFWVCWMVYTFLGPHLKYEVAVKVSLGQQTVVGSAQKSDVFYCVWPSEGIGVLMMKLEHARRLAATTGVTDKGAASPIPFDANAGASPRQRGSGRAAQLGPRQRTVGSCCYRSGVQTASGAAPRFEHGGPQSPPIRPTSH